MLSLLRLFPLALVLVPGQPGRSLRRGRVLELRGVQQAPDAGAVAVKQRGRGRLALRHFRWAAGCEPASVRNDGKIRRRPGDPLEGNLRPPDAWECLEQPARVR